jgi:hypothetical protein
MWIEGKLSRMDTSIIVSSIADSNHPLQATPLILVFVIGCLGSNRKDLVQEFDDDKSKSATTITFRTNDTAPSIMID